MQTEGKKGEVWERDYINIESKVNKYITGPPHIMQCSPQTTSFTQAIITISLGKVFIFRNQTQPANLLKCHTLSVLS